MFDVNIDKSDVVLAEHLESMYPYVKSQLTDGEKLLAYSGRKPLYASGGFCIAVGVYIIIHIVLALQLLVTQWAILAILLSGVMVYIGIWAILFLGREYVFITGDRIVHQKVNLLGRLKDLPCSIQISDISGVRHYKKLVMFSAYTKTKSGDIIIKTNNGITYVIPTLKDSISVSEKLNEAVSFQQLNYE